MARAIPKKYQGNLQPANITQNAGGGVSMSVTIITDNYITFMNSRRDVWLGEGYHRQLAQFLNDKTQSQFEREVDYNDVPWKPLAASTLAQKLRLGYSEKILTRTGETRASISTTSDASQAILTIGGNAHWHQATRPIIGLGEQDKPKVKELSESYVRNKTGI